MTDSKRSVAIVGATGPIGRALAAELLRRGDEVTAISRSEAGLRRAFGALDVVERPADAADREDLRAALDGRDVVFHCVGLPLSEVDRHASLGRCVVAAAAEAGCSSIVQVSSYWSYLPVESQPLTESHPRRGGPAAARARREAEDVFSDAGAVVAQLPDFFGPKVGDSSVQRCLAAAVERKPVSCVGHVDSAREAGYVPDLVRVVADLADVPQARGRRVLVPGCGRLSARDLAELAGAALGRPVGLRAVPPWMLRLAAPFNRDLRDFLPLVPAYARPLAFDATRCRELVGEVAATPPERAVAETLASIRPSP